MGSSAEDEPDASGGDSGEGSSAPPEHPQAIISQLWTTSSLPPEFAQRLAEVRRLVREARGRALTPGEEDAVASLIQSLRAILGARRPV
jgi:hypothetical protein